MTPKETLEGLVQPEWHRKFDKHWSQFKRPTGISLQHYAHVKWLGRVGFVSKGIVYAVMGGLCISTAAHLDDEVYKIQSPMGVFIYLGLFSMGTPLLAIMLIGISFYSIWRFWEGIYGQGADQSQSVFKNFFRCRLSPIVSGCVYIVYLTYIGKLLAKSREERIAMGSLESDNCFPSCWGRSSNWLQRAAVAMFGIAFLIACITQLQNVLSKRWHADLMVHHCTSFEKWTMFALGHLGFLARAGVFMFVAVFMFKSMREEVPAQHDTFSEALNQITEAHNGVIALWILGIGLIFFGVFATLNAYYKYYPTPPPYRKPFLKKNAIVKPTATDDTSSRNTETTRHTDIMSSQMMDNLPVSLTRQSSFLQPNGVMPLSSISSVPLHSSILISDETSFPTQPEGPPSPWENTARYRMQTQASQRPS